MTVMRTWTTFPDCVLKKEVILYLCYDSAYTGRSIPLTAFDGFTFLLCFHITGTLVICMKKFDAEKIFFYKMAAL